MNNISISKDHKLYLKKVKIKKMTILTVQIFIVLAFFIVWELAASFHLIDSFLTSQPSRIVKTILNLYKDGGFVQTYRCYLS